MHITIMIAIIFAIILSMFLWTLFFMKKNGQTESNCVINKFEPDNDAPTLTEMIKFHKDNGIIEYEI